MRDIINRLLYRQPFLCISLWIRKLIFYTKCRAPLDILLDNHCLVRVVLVDMKLHWLTQ